MNDQQKNRLLKADDIAVMLGLKVQTVYTMARRGELEKVKLSRKCLRFRADEVERFIERKAGLWLMATRLVTSGFSPVTAVTSLSLRAVRLVFSAVTISLCDRLKNSPNSLFSKACYRCDRSA